MEGIGILFLLALLVGVPLSMWIERAQRFSRLTEVEKTLQRVSHGVAVPIVTVAGAVLFFGPSVPQEFVAALVRNPASVGWPGVLIVALFAYCFVRARAGMQRVVGDPDGLLIPRARVKLISGAVGLVLLWPANTDLARGLLLLCLWCAVTGAVRYLRLTRRSASAAILVQKAIEADEFEWEPPRRRRWWQF